MKLPKTFAKDNKMVYAVIETPRGSRNKYTYDEQNDYFELTKVLPAGTVFPLDFGFIPNTLAEDGDPLDILVITDYPGFTGCVVKVRVIGVLMVEQTEKDGKSMRNDRIISVASDSLNFADLKNIVDMNINLLDEIIHFFGYYNEMAGKEFKLLKKQGSSTALKLIKQKMNTNKNGTGK